MTEPVWPTIAVARKQRHPLSLADILRVLDAIPADRLGVYLVMLYTSCRPGG